MPQGRPLSPATCALEQPPRKHEAAAGRQDGPSLDPTAELQHPGGHFEGPLFPTARLSARSRACYNTLSLSPPIIDVSLSILLHLLPCCSLTRKSNKGRQKKNPRNRKPPYNGSSEEDAELPMESSFLARQLPECPPPGAGLGGGDGKPTASYGQPSPSLDPTAEPRHPGGHSEGPLFPTGKLSASRAESRKEKFKIHW